MDYIDYTKRELRDIQNLVLTLQNNMKIWYNDYTDHLSKTNQNRRFYI